MAWLLAAAAATAATREAPAIIASARLPAAPAALSLGSSGPLNRLWLELRGFSADDRAAQVHCVYADRFAYLCRFERQPGRRADTQQIVVTIPDLARGARVAVRLVSSGGTLEHTLTIDNSAQVVHEIEALPLPNGGRVGTGPQGEPVAMTDLVVTRASAMPAMASSTLGAVPACDQVRAEWQGASATDAVFTSIFGALQGSVVLTRPPARGSAVRPDNLPEWTVSYPLSANRVQFIAHYEVVYRVGECSERVLRSIDEHAKP